jgi:hypothetical protein
LTEPFGTSNDPFQTIPSYSNPAAGFAQSNSPLQYSPDSSLSFDRPAEGSTHPGFINHQGQFDGPDYTNKGQVHPGLSGDPCKIPKDTGFSHELKAL